jgi:NADH-quinone oxidoreductase subunit H
MADFWSGYAVPTLIYAGWTVLIILILLLLVAYLTFAERKVLAAVQIRRGPNVVGPWGLLQPIADGVKLVFKETIIPTTANRVVFMIAPMVTFVLALVAWAVIPFDSNLVLADINVGVLYLFAISSLGVYGVIMAGWASNSKYPFLGALRSAAQMVSYEVSIGFVIITMLIPAGSLNLNDIIESQRGESGYFWNWYAFGLLAPMAVVFYISALAETNRVPFDLPEGESELVAGFFAEYSSMSFGLFFLGEYANIFLMSTSTTIFFLGGWLSPFPFAPFTWIPGLVWFLLKMFVVVFLFLLVRATFPRYRYDQLMRLGWKVFLPISLLWVVVAAGAWLTLPRWVF